MACYAPLTGWLARSVNPSGKRSVVFDKSLGFADRPLSIPCGLCLGCKLSYSSEWATRCVNEASLHVDNCFLTLTYNDSSLPVNSSVVPKHLTDFWKRLRKRYDFRYFSCSEYGERTRRPHYHAVVFGYRPTDGVFYKSSSDGARLYSSAYLADVWKFGYVHFGDVTFDSCAYVSRYVAKKLDDEIVDYAYTDLFEPRAYMSNRPGIGKAWALKYWPEFMFDDRIVLSGGRIVPVPTYYLNVLESICPREVAAIKRRRSSAAVVGWSENLGDRLKVREEVAKAKVSLKRRSLE